MLFNSLQFIVFFVIVLVLYFSISHKFRWIILLAASYYFYMSWNAKYIILIIISTLVDYIVCRFLEKEEKQSRRNALLITSLVANLGMLFAFKYFNFFSESLTALTHAIGLSLDAFTINVILPVGISFYTFQTLSYTIDVYRKKIKPEHHLGYFATYVAFFPQLVAGPIERAYHLLPQFREEHHFDTDQFFLGLRRMLWGFVKKMVIADRAAYVVNIIYADPSSYGITSFILATILFGVQIYADFSGYTDIARGAARMMGFRIMKNFNAPYSATSMKEFWARWHISLSTWFKEYVYFPLGGNRISPTRTAINTLIVFLLSGLWHGAGWNFVLWGLINGIVLVVEKAYLGKISKTISFLITQFFVFVAWSLFRIESLSQYLMFASKTFLRTIIPPDWVLYNGGIAVLASLFIIGEHIMLRRSRKPLTKWQTSVVCAVYFIIIMLFGVFTEQQFIYFQF